MPAWLKRLFPGAAAPMEPALLAASSVSQPPGLPAEAQQSGVSPVEAATWIARGNASLESGRLDEAARCYAQALAIEPDSVAASVNLGFANLEMGRPADARAALEKALAVDGSNADALYMLGRLALDQPDPARAIGHLERLLQDHPGFLLAYPMLCRAYFEGGRRADALAALRSGLAIDPNAADLHHDLANLLLLDGDTEGAASSYQAALSLDSQRVDTRVGLGHALLHLGRHAEAREHLDRALAEQPASAEACLTLGTALQALGELEPAAQAYALAIQRDEGQVLPHQNLGILRQAQGRADAARASFQRVTELTPDSPVAWANLGTAHQDLRQYAQAEACYRRALALDPGHPRSHAQLAVLAVERGHTEAALGHFEEALRLDPENLEVRSNQLWVLCYGADPDRYLAAAAEYGRRSASQARPFADWPVGTPAQEPRPNRLRVGLVSGDLRAHPVGYFIESVMAELANHHIDVHAFPTSSYTDDVTARLARTCAGWTPLVGMFDEVAARRIRDERIHVLVDLAGHTAHNRLRVFSWRPAPVQASWLGYFASTGVEAIDYLLADPMSVPDELLAQFTETVWHLPHTRLCFTSPGDEAAFPVSPPPALKRGHVMFGCYQNLSKVGDEVLAVWQRVMRELPTAKLRLQSKQTDDTGRGALLERLAAAGFDLPRIVLAPPAPRASYLASYAEVDVLLDTFPFPGGTTTCEALWMGVPTVTMAGRSMMANQGKALLTCAGLPDCVASDADEYVARAVSIASDLPSLAALRARLRARVIASPLFDGPRFAADLADALFAMWQRGPRPARALPSAGRRAPAR